MLHFLKGLLSDVFNGGLSRFSENCIKLIIIERERKRRVEKEREGKEDILA